MPPNKMQSRFLDAFWCKCWVFKASLLLEDVSSDNIFSILQTFYNFLVSGMHFENGPGIKIAYQQIESWFPEEFWKGFQFILYISKKLKFNFTNLLHSNTKSCCLYYDGSRDRKQASTKTLSNIKSHHSQAIIYPKWQPCFPFACWQSLVDCWCKIVSNLRRCR
jgi:hypothetical protein